MAARYWVGGAGTWSSTNTTNWSATSGGAGGASVPTSADTPTFDANSGTGVVTFTNGGVTVGATTINKSSIELSLGAAFTTSGALTLTTGTLSTNGYTVSAASLSSSNTNTRTINLGSSTVTLSGTTPITFTTTTGLTFNAGTSSLVFTSTGAQTLSAGANALTFYDVSCNGTAAGTTTFSGTATLTFNNLSFAAISVAGIRAVAITQDLIVNGTLTLSAGADATRRTFMLSGTFGVARTVTCAAVASLTDIDFRDIAIAGAAAPVSGTRLGDCKGNSGISFPAPKTVYFRGTLLGQSWGNNWSFTSGGTLDSTAFPLAQDTAVFPAATYPPNNSTVTTSIAYNIGTVDMSARVGNTMTLATSNVTVTLYGSWINGTAVSTTGTGTVIFAGRNAQTIRSAGKTFPQSLRFDSPGGSITLEDAFTANRADAAVFVHASGTFDANGYSVTLSGTTFGRVTSTGTATRTLAIGSGTWTLAASGTPWSVASTGLTVTGAGAISLTSASAKTFAGGDVKSYPTINQGGTGALTITGSNKFANITNTAIGSVLFTGGTTNQFDDFNLNGTSTAARLTVGSTNTTQAILKKPGAWNVGAGSLDNGNNTGLSFT